MNTALFDHCRIWWKLLSERKLLVSCTNTGYRVCYW